MVPRDPATPRTRRRKGLVALLFALVLAGVGGWLALRPAPIRPGMSRAEVEAILGPPNGRMLAIDGTPTEDFILVWKDRKIVVKFDEAQRVWQVTHAPTFLENLRSKFGF